MTVDEVEEDDEVVDAEVGVDEKCMSRMCTNSACVVSDSMDNVVDVSFVLNPHLNRKKSPRQDSRRYQ